MKYLIALSLVLLLLPTSIAAQKKTFDLKEVYASPALYPQRVAALQWIPGTQQYSFIDNNQLLRSNLKGTDEVVMTLDQLNEYLKTKNLEASKRFLMMTWKSADRMEFFLNDSLYSIDLKAKTLSTVCYFPENADNITPNPAYTDYQAFTRDNNLYILRNNKEVAVTKESNTGIVSGQSISRNEFGIEGGIFWSPKGNLLAFYQKDETVVSEYPLVNIDARVATAEMVRYPMAGMPSESVMVWVYNPETEKNTLIDSKVEKEGYLTNLSWSPDEKYLYIQVLNRQQNHLKLNQFDAETGAFIKTLFEEKNQRYVEPENPIYFLNNQSNQFVYLSEADGFMHAYLYNTDGKLIQQLTKGPWMINEFLGFSDDNKQMFFTSTQESPLEKNFYVLDMKSLKIKRVTTIEGTHAVQLSSDKKYAIDRYSNMKGIAAEYVIWSVDQAKVLKTIKANVDPLKDYDLGEMTIDKLKAADGTDLYYRMIKPANFEAGKKYPVVVYVYGGPHAQLITNSWMAGSGYFLQYLAAKGYVVFTLDNRGSANRGNAFESVIHRQLGVLEMQDQMTGINFLKTLDFVDTNRIGVNGWSYGGFMTTSLMLNHPETFKVGVAGGPVIDWKYYEVMYGERYMDTPEENPEGYAANSTLAKVKNLKGQLMLIHGTMDATVVWQHSQLFLKECVNQQKNIDYFVYPGHEHNVRGKDRLHLELKIARYFDDYL